MENGKRLVYPLVVIATYQNKERTFWKWSHITIAILNTIVAYFKLIKVLTLKTYVFIRRVHGMMYKIVQATDKVMDVWEL